MVMLVLVVAGCGGGDSSGSTGSSASSEPLTRAQFVQRANEICAEARTEGQSLLAKFVEEGGKVQSRDMGVEAVDAAILPSVEKELSRLEELQPPAQTQDAYEAFLEERGEALVEVDEKDLSSNIELLVPFERSDQQAQQLGLDGCSLSA
jgi:hypothetical protein